MSQPNSLPHAVMTTPPMSHTTNAALHPLMDSEHGGEPSSTHFGHNSFNTSSERALSISSAPQFSLHRPSRPFQQPTTTAAATQEPAADQALQVRGHLIRSIWLRLRELGCGQRWILVLRLTLSLLQIVPAIVILSLPTSLGNSPGPNGATCDPEPIFVFLALHTVRVVASVPLDFYLALSPHRSSRQRRPGASGQAERERSRTIGSLNLDRKAAKLADLLGFIHVILFAVGNYSVWTRTDCSSQPADSVPLFWTSFAILCVSYFFVVVIVTLTFLVVFFLPALLAVLRSLGLTHRLPTAAIRPETGKINKEDVEKVTRLVYFVQAQGEEEKEATAAKDVAARSSPVHFQEGSKDQTPANDDKLETTDATPKTGQSRPSLGLSNTASAKPIELATDAIPSGPTVVADDTRVGPRSSPTMEAAPSLHLWRPMTVLLPWRSRPRAIRAQQSAEDSENASKTPPVEQAAKISENLKYPLHPLPPHRSACPICLCDFESPTVRGGLSELSTGRDLPQDFDTHAVLAGSDGNAEEPEPLRLLPCGHALHRSCVDEWLTTVSGRCPVCQRPVLPGSGLDEDASAGSIAVANEEQQPPRIRGSQ